jgi:6-pyruvoyltetrahydropterin/6-carboxytetrahydropterin synthase
VFEVTLETHFCAAHALRAYKGGTEPLHGHNFHVEVTVQGERVDAAGMLIDFLELKPIVDAEVARFHHLNLNETEAFGQNGLSPSAEHIAWVLYRNIAPKLPAGVKLAKVRVGEAPGSWAAFFE